MVIVIRRFIEIIKKNPHLVKATIIALVIIVAFLFTFWEDKEEGGISIETQGSQSSIEETLANSEESELEKPGTIIVDVGGAVNNPGVIELPEGSRVFQAIEKAGGVTKEGDLGQINQAILLNDCDKLYIPTFQDAENQKISPNNLSGVGLVSNKANNDGLVNINTATQQELETLKGVGPVTANKIIDYRTINGRFDAIENIMEVSGIGEKTFAAMKECICI